MKFWIATCTLKESGEKVINTYASDENMTKEKVKKCILEVNEEYSRVTLKKAKKPKNWTIFENV